MEEQKIDDTVIKNLRELVSTKNLFIKTFGQIGVKRRELERQINELDQIESEANDSFKLVDDQIHTISKELEKKYHNGSLNLDTGMITYRSQN